MPLDQVHACAPCGPGALHRWAQLGPLNPPPGLHPVRILAARRWTGRPVEPRNLVRSFRRICSAHGLRPIKVHHLRHTTATLLKNLGVPARDAQLILGHSRLAVTLEIYTHEDRQSQHDALTRISEALRGDGQQAK